MSIPGKIKALSLIYFATMLFLSFFWKIFYIPASSIKKGDDIIFCFEVSLGLTVIYNIFVKVFYNNYPVLLALLLPFFSLLPTIIILGFFDAILNLNDQKSLHFYFGIQGFISVFMVMIFIWLKEKPKVNRNIKQF